MIAVQLRPVEREVPSTCMHAETENFHDPKFILGPLKYVLGVLGILGPGSHGDSHGGPHAPPPGHH